MKRSRGYTLVEETPEESTYQLANIFDDIRDSLDVEARSHEVSLWKPLRTSGNDFECLANTPSTMPQNVFSLQSGATSPEVASEGKEDKIERFRCCSRTTVEWTDLLAGLIVMINLR